MKTLYHWYCRAEETVCCSFLFAIVVLVFSSAFLRLFKMPLIWADDIAKLLFAWAAFLGADIAMRRCRLVGVDILVNRFKPKTKKIVQLGGYIVMTIILLLFVYYGYRLIGRSWSRYFQTISISYAYVTMSLPVGSLCMALTAIIKIGKLLLNLNDDTFSLIADGRGVKAGSVEEAM